MLVRASYSENQKIDVEIVMDGLKSMIDAWTCPPQMLEQLHPPFDRHGDLVLSWHRGCPIGVLDVPPMVDER
jgi:hypothetical protein